MSTKSTNIAMRDDDDKPSPADSRRDRFAANAMQALIAKYGMFGVTKTEAGQLAVAAYIYAEAMMAERERRR